MKLKNNPVSYPECSLLRSWPGKRLTDGGTATRHELDGTVFEPPSGMRFFVRSGPEAKPASCTIGIGSLPGVKWPGRDVEHPPALPSRVQPVNE